MIKKVHDSTSITVDKTTQYISHGATCARLDVRRALYDAKIGNKTVKTDLDNKITVSFGRITIQPSSQPGNGTHDKRSAMIPNIVSELVSTFFEYSDGSKRRKTRSVRNEWLKSPPARYVRM